VIRAQGDLLDAELQLAKNREDRIRILAERLKAARELETVTKHRHQAAAVSLDSWLTAKAERLQAEVDLLREEAARN